MSINNLRFTALIKKEVSGTEEILLAPYTDFPEKIYCYKDTLENVIDFTPIIFKIPEEKVGSPVIVDVGIKTGKEFKTLRSEAKYQDVFIMNLDKSIKEYFSSNEGALNIIKNLVLWPSENKYVSFTENSATKKYSKEINEVYQNMFDIENKSLEGLLETENDEFIYNELLDEIDDFVSNSLTFDDLKKSHEDWSPSISLIEKVLSKRNVHITIVFGNMVGFFSEEKTNDAIKFIKTCLSEYGDRHIKSPEGLFCIIRYETPFKMSGNEFNEKLVAGCLLIKNNLLKIDKDGEYLIFAHETNEKEVTFVNVDVMLKHLGIK